MGMRQAFGECCRRGSGERFGDVEGLGNDTRHVPYHHQAWRLDTASRVLFFQFERTFHFTLDAFRLVFFNLLETAI